jgi:hypothetical protein
MNNNEPIIVPLSISAVPMSRAFSWYKNALLLIKAQPLVMFLTSAWIVFAELFLAGVLPIVGTVMFLLISPAIAFGMADLCQKIRLQQPASPLSIFSPLLHSIRNRLLSLGLIFAVVLFALFILSQTFVEQTAMGDILNKIIALQKLDDLEQMRAQSREVFALILQQKKLILAFGIMLAGSTLAQILLMYSPMYAVWQNAEAPQAVWLSVRTLFKNILPIALSIALLALTLGALSVLVSITGMFAPSMIMLFMMGAWILFNTLINALTYTSYYDIIRRSLTNSVQASVEQIINSEEHK